MCESTEQRICIKFCEDVKFLKNVLIGDESWVYGYDTDTKQHSSQWKRPTSPRPKKGRQVRSKTKVMLMAFFDSEGIVHHEYVPDGQTINKEFYLKVLRRLYESVRRNNRKNGGMATGSCTTTMRLHTLHILCSSSGQTLHHSVAVAAILTRSRTV